MRSFFIFGLFLCLLSCKEATKKQSIAQSIDQTALIEQFVQSLTEQQFDTAHEVLHDELASAWSKESFIEDLNSIQQQLVWQPQITEVATGPSPQGPYRKVIYRLEKPKASRASLEVMVMKSAGRNKIVQILVRQPLQSAPNAELLALSQTFEKAMRAEDFELAQSLFSESSQANFSPMILKQMKHALADIPQDNAAIYLRVLANSTWYHAVELGKKNEPHTKLELIFDSTHQQVKIHSLSYKSSPTALD
jgi:hypothetical protein